MTTFSTPAPRQGCPGSFLNNPSKEIYYSRHCFSTLPSSANPSRFLTRLQSSISSENGASIHGQKPWSTAPATVRLEWHASQYPYLPAQESPGLILGHLFPPSTVRKQQHWMTSDSSSCRPGRDNQSMLCQEVTVVAEIRGYEPTHPCHG